MVKPDEPVTPPVGTLDDAASRVAWLDSYGGGECFYATATHVSDNSIDIEAFGTSAAPFETMLERFKEVHKVEPNIGVRLIEQQQCAVADFLQALRSSPAERPDLSLSSDLVRSGQALRGSLGNLEGRKTDVLLVDNAGVVYNLGAHLKTGEQGQSFNIKLGLSTEEPVPQMIIALTSPNGLDTAKVEQPVLAATLFPKILDEIHDKNVEASATAKYFKLGG
jgi:serine/threonine-protein kinase